MRCISLNNMWTNVSYTCLFDRMPPKRTSKEKKKLVSISSTTRSRELDGEYIEILNRETSSRYNDIISHSALLVERLDKLEDFSRFEIVTLVRN